MAPLQDAYPIGCIDTHGCFAIKGCAGESAAESLSLGFVILGMAELVLCSGTVRGPQNDHWKHGQLTASLAARCIVRRLGVVDCPM